MLHRRRRGRRLRGALPGRGRASRPFRGRWLGRGAGRRRRVGAGPGGNRRLRLVGGKGTLGRPIKRSEITQPSPYNTYVIDGLPPGPIANPGRASLEAAANPARTRDLFFVADGTGGHAFADTYDQHQKNVQRLRSLEQQASGAAAPPAAAAPVAAPATRTR